MTKHLISGYFRGPSDGDWEQLAGVLRHTAHRHCPDWEIRVEHIEPTEMYSSLGVPVHVFNTQKMEHWNRSVQELADGDVALLIDADTAILRPLDDVWDLDFDVAYTARPDGCRFPFNSGVVFLRVTEATKAFVQAWWEENARMLIDGTRHQWWNHKYGGINQASLGYAIEKQDSWGADLLALPCREWNCEDSTWAQFDETTRIVHFKSALRSAITGNKAGLMVAGVPPLAELWETLARQAGQRVTAVGG